jgi:uroporphyrinogen-III decarboxylase
MAVSTTTEQLHKKVQQWKKTIERRQGKTIEQLRLEREKRFHDAATLKTPDRVPVTIGTGVFACRYVGIPLSTMYYDQIAYREACAKTVVDFDPDTDGNVLAGGYGMVNELLDTRTARWPGGNLPEDVPYQFVEGEYMKEDEYDLFLSDPSDFVFRYYLPRAFGILQPLSQLPPLRNLAGGFFSGVLAIMAQPQFRKLGEKLSQAITEQDKQTKMAMELATLEGELGYPSMLGRLSAGVGGAPFDAISDMLRGMRGAMLDMYRCPDKLLAACEMIQKWRFDAAVPARPDQQGYRPRVFMALHRGSDGFMSKQQFEKFYWPGLKKAIIKAVELGYDVFPFFEGVWDDRLEYLLELPKGRVIFFAERTDLVKAKKVLGKHMCIQGGVPPTLLQAGSTQDIEEHVKKLIKTVGKGGGLIVSPQSAMDYARPENVRTMVETVKKYGNY